MVLVGFGAAELEAAVVDPALLPGLVLDDSSAETVGKWQKSTSVRSFVGAGYLHDQNQEKGKKLVRFRTHVPQAGQYVVLMSWAGTAGRAKNVPVTVATAEGLQKITVNQSKPPKVGPGFHRLGTFRLEPASEVVISVSNEGTEGFVIVDAFLLLTPQQFQQFQLDIKKLVAAKAKKAPPKKKKAPPEPAPVLTKSPPPAGLRQLTPGQLDALLADQLGKIAEDQLAGDDVFFRRATLDLLGRQPTLKEQRQFQEDRSAGKRAAAIERLLQSDRYGRNWANYWSDVIGSRQQEPQLTFHDYQPFQDWLAAELNKGTTWDAIVFAMLTAAGKVGDAPQATFIGFHQANANRLAGETTRVFLGVQIACAQCHDHPFVDMPTEVFHGMAAFYARTEAKIPQLHSSGIEIKGKSKGEHAIPGRKESIDPTVLGGKVLAAKQSDLKRRVALAHWIVAPSNRAFARAYVNRLWSRLMGRGFYEPVDNLGEDAYGVLPELLEAVCDQFIASGYDHKRLCALLMNTRYYQRALSQAPPTEPAGGLAKPADLLRRSVTMKLRGDEVFDCLATAVELPNLTPPRAKKTQAVRFPPPPQSTRDLVNAAFGYDPSLAQERVVRTIREALFLMNNEQLQQQIDASPESNTFLAKLLKAQNDDQVVIQRLFQAVLARRPTSRELAIAQKHLSQVDNRQTGFEDLLWGLLNSTEFTTRR